MLSQDVGPMLTNLTSGDSFGPQTVQDMIDDHVAVIANHKFGSKSDMTEVLVINQVRNQFFFNFFFLIFKFLKNFVRSRAFPSSSLLTMSSPYLLLFIAGAVQQSSS